VEGKKRIFFTLLLKVDEDKDVLLWDDTADRKRKD
jgi:hypothetical protein